MKTGCTIQDIEALEVRRVKANLYYLYKIVNKLVGIDHDRFLSYISMATRGHHFKIKVKNSRVNCKSIFFMNRAISMWNNLDSNIVNCDVIFKFKRELNDVDLTCYCCAYRATEVGFACPRDVTFLQVMHM